jgi:hypothetical protein
MAAKSYEQRVFEVLKSHPAVRGLRRSKPMRSSERGARKDNGWPDIDGWVLVRVSDRRVAAPLYWECKDPSTSDRMSAEQVEFMDRAETDGCFCGLGNAESMGELYERLNGDLRDGRSTWRHYWDGKLRRAKKL